MIRLGINGFGRIGRQVLKAVLERYPQTLQVAAVNDLFDVETNAHLFRYDTNYGRFPGDVTVKKDSFVINGQAVRSYAFRDPAAIPWMTKEWISSLKARGFSSPGPRPRRTSRGARRR